MRSVAQVRCAQHRAQSALEWPRRIGQEVRHPAQALVRLGVQHVQDRSNQQRMRGLLPVTAPLQRTFRVDQQVGDVLHIAYLLRAAAHLQQGVRSEEHTSELQSLMRISYAVFRLKKKKKQTNK